MRIATQKDLPAIVAIYNATVPTRQSTADIVDVTIESRMKWFKEHGADTRPLMVYEQDNAVVAWVSFQSFYGRPAYVYTAEISIYIAVAYQGKGLGKMLLAEALGMTNELRIKTVLGFVFAHNTPSIRLLTSFGFTEWGNLPNVAEMDGNEYSLLILGKRIR